MKMTEAFITNITDDFACGLSDDTHNFKDINDLLADKDELIAYTKRMIQLNTTIMADSHNPFLYCSKIKCYKSFIQKAEEGK
jgi:hypothetical protein